MKKLRKRLQAESIDETVKLDELKRCLIRAAEDDSFSYDGDEAVRSVENFYSIRIVEKGNQPRLSDIKGFDKAFETYDWVYLIEGEEAERDSGESALSFWSADEALEKNYKVLAHGWEDRMTMYWIVVDKSNEMLNENTKVTLTIGQLKKLVKESGNKYHFNDMMLTLSSISEIAAKAQAIIKSSYPEVSDADVEELKDNAESLRKMSNYLNELLGN